MAAAADALPQRSLLSPLPFTGASRFIKKASLAGTGV